MRTQQALRETDPVRALALANEARDTYQMYANGRNRAYNWEDVDQREFFKIYNKIAMNAADVSPRLPREDWFTQANIDSGASRIAIALAANEVWAEHNGIVDGVSTGEQYRAQMMAYRDFVTKVHEEAKAVGPDAVKVLGNALTDHATGQLRTDKTADYKSPPEFMWNWINSD